MPKRKYTRFEFTPRENDVFEHLRRGLSNREIAARMFVTISAVKAHVTEVYRKTGFKTRSQFIAGIARLPHGRE